MRFQHGRPAVPEHADGIRPVLGAWHRADASALEGTAREGGAPSLLHRDPAPEAGQCRTEAVTAAEPEGAGPEYPCTDLVVR
ncbi:hypothetical protein GCM10009527_028940 [Actinomadura nitritigenes]